MYVEFGEQLINSMYFGNIEKVDVNDNGTTKYLLRYEMTNGSVYDKEYISESVRNDDYNHFKNNMDNVFVITLTPENADFSGTMDKTAEEITEAYYAGKEIWFNVVGIPGFDTVMIRSNAATLATDFSLICMQGYIVYLPSTFIYILTNDVSGSSTYSTRVYSLTEV